MNWNLLGQVNFGTMNLSYLDYDHGPLVNITSSLSKWCLGKRCVFVCLFVCFVKFKMCHIRTPPSKVLLEVPFFFSWAPLVSQMVKNQRQCRRPRFHPWVRKIPWRSDGYLLQCSCLENSIDRGAW